MDKISTREWVAFLEEMIEAKLSKWKRHNRLENGETIQLHWQWEQAHFQLNIFWEDGKELVTLKYLTPRTDCTYRWHGLTDRTFSKIMDRIGNLAQTTMHPPIDPEDRDD